MPLVEPLLTNKWYYCIVYYYFTTKNVTVFVNIIILLVGVNNDTIIYKDWFGMSNGNSTKFVWLILLYYLKLFLFVQATIPLVQGNTFFTHFVDPSISKTTTTTAIPIIPDPLSKSFSHEYRHCKLTFS